jgi:hypothetical protein
MNCEHAIELMQRYVDNDLSEQENLVLNAHLRDCPSCALSFDRLQALHEQLLQLPKIKPRYSIVDSILPKLLEMDGQTLENEREESASLDADEPRMSPSEPVSEPARTRRYFGYVSWKLTGAVAAAACAVLFFIWNNGESIQQNKQAGEPAILKVTEKSSAPSVNAPIAAAQSDAPKIMPTPTPTPSETPEANANMKQIVEQTPVTEQKTTEVTVLQSKIKASGDLSVSADAKTNLTVPAPSPSASPALKGDETAKGITAASPTPGTGEGYGIALIAPEIPKIIPEDPNKNKRVSNGQYVAEVKDHKLTISSVATNTVVFTSLLQWTDLESVIPISWTPEGKFYYEVVGNGAVRAFLVDVKSRTEQQIPK